LHAGYERCAVRIAIVNLESSVASEAPEPGRRHLAQQRLVDIGPAQ
jgi:hypothetical protein